ncbi:MAG: GAF domain-containing protein [Flavobacterium sp.]|nr:MAG: GAF domain-containing protein [Flavobacterium sp.]
MSEPLHDFYDDIENIGQIPIVKTLLDVICSTTGMGFAAIARVTEDRWVTCSVRDDIGFGIVPGGELAVKTTICNDIRQRECAIVIDHVAIDPVYKDHHTPATYGFQSYISVPIHRRDGSFFGTLCAIDPKPNSLKTDAVTGMFKLFADLISFHLSAVESLKMSASKVIEDKAFIDLLEVKVAERTQELKENNSSLEKINKELQSFNYISSHDLQEPLQKIKTLTSFITERENDNLSQKGKDYFKKIKNAADRMQALINDLLSYSRTNIAERNFEITDIDEVLQEVLSDIREDIQQKNAEITATEMCTSPVIRFQIKQLLHNLICNSLKFSRPGVNPQIVIRSILGKGKDFNHHELLAESGYCHISISDNGIGFDQDYKEKIFEMFQRLHERTLYAGTGIGLAIVKKIVENHNGLITARGRLNQGATFDIFLPTEKIQ